MPNFKKGFDEQLIPPNVAWSFCKLNQVFNSKHVMHRCGGFQCKVSKVMKKYFNLLMKIPFTAH